MENNLLFVYGTLRPSSGHPMAQRLARAGHCLGEASLTGLLHDAGGYPVLTPGAGNVAGEIYALHEPDWDVFDRYEEAFGPEPLYERRLTPVRLTTGPWLEAWAYWYCRPLDGMPRIVSGDWLLWRP